MKVLPNIQPTPEQLQIIQRFKPGPLIIRGAAGSGKTSTALLRLRSLIGSWLKRRERLHLQEPVNLLVLTFNRTLRGYIQELAKSQVTTNEGIVLTISTFAKWAKDLTGYASVLDDAKHRSTIQSLGANILLDTDFLVDEIDYITGRFLPEKFDDYVTCRRDGRGATPRVDRELRRKILDEIIMPYNKWKVKKGVIDWNDLAIKLSKKRIADGYDIIICDETQDFSANEIRAIKEQLKEDYSLTLILDAVQSIYTRGFTWSEVGISIRPENIFRLKKNYRNTVEIARLALPLLEGLRIDEDGTLPDFKQCERHGPVPKVLKGRYSQQLDYVIKYIKKEINLEKESVVFLHPKGWFNTMKSKLEAAGFDYVTITRESAWSDGNENIALSTMHSAKGLEFDHVIIIGLNQELTPHGSEEGDDRLERLRRLLAMSIGRARKSVILGYKPDEASSLIQYLDPSTYEKIEL